MGIAEYLQSVTPSERDKLTKYVYEYQSKPPEISEFDMVMLMKGWVRNHREEQRGRKDD